MLQGWVSRQTCSGDRCCAPRYMWAALQSGPLRRRKAQSCIASPVPAWQLEKSWLWAPLAWDGDASRGEAVSLPSLRVGQRTDPAELLRKGRLEAPTTKTWEITKRVRTAEGWSDRRNTRGPKASSKSYLGQPSHQPPN